MTDRTYISESSSNGFADIAITESEQYLAKTQITAIIFETIIAKRENILDIAAKHGASNVRIFGSLVRGEAQADSDIDFLMDIEPGRSLLNRIGLIQELEDLLGRKVDVAKPENLHECIRDQVLKEAIPL